MNVVHVAQYESDSSNEEIVQGKDGINRHCSVLIFPVGEVLSKQFFFWEKSGCCDACINPSAAKTTLTGEKRKRGRPAKAKPALLVQ